MNPIREELKKKYINQIKGILEDYKKIVPIISTAFQPNTEKRNKIYSIITRVITAIERITTKKSGYYKMAEELLKKNDYDKEKVVNVIGVLEGLYKDLDADNLKSLSEIIHGDIFTDYLDMGEYLLKEHYYVAAAVIAGVTLEEHLRILCIKNEIDIVLIKPRGNKPKSADTMNADLSKEGVYPKTQQKQITYWLGIRNDAAHGKKDNFTEEQVRIMIVGIRDFIIKYPA